MRILFVSECYPTPERPQYAIYLEQQAKALCELGHTVDILIPKISGIEPSRIEKGKYGGLTVFHATIKAGRLSRLLWLYSRKSILDGFDWKQYDAVSLHIASHGILPSVLKNCKKCGVPVLQHFHGLNVWQGYYGKAGILHRVLLWRNATLRLRHLKGCSAIVGVSNKVCDVVRERLESVPLFTVYNGVDLAKFPANSKQENQAFTVICVANLIRIKGHDYLLEAIAKIRDEKLPVRLQLVGAGPEEFRLKQRCVTLGISDVVEFLGWQEYEEVARLMTGADMFVMPSYFEAFGCVFLEAMSTGTLTVGCCDTGAAEIIEDGRNGFLVPQKDAIALANLFLWQRENKEKAAEIASAGVLRAQEFTWLHSAKALEGVYKRVTGGSLL